MDKKPWVRIQAGERFGQLVTISKERDGIRTWWWCQCDCGKKSRVWSGFLKNGHTKTCGCGQGGVKHRQSNTKLHRVWIAQRSRCRNPDTKGYKNYGGRGISFCVEWDDFLVYKAHIDSLGPKPSPRHSLDRINNNGNYEPGNLRWATPKEQIRNSRIYKGKTP